MRPPAGFTPQQALELLKAGNLRYQQGIRSIDTTTSPKRMRELAQAGQRPFAIVLTCSDSRVPAEIIFDQGLGDLFVVRVAGNVVAGPVLASIEFAVEALKTPLALVMGHTACGAIRAAVETELDGTPHASPNIEELLQSIRPAVRKCIHEQNETDREVLGTLATRHNVQHSLQKLFQASPMLQALSKEGKFLATGAVYDVFSGQVRFEVDQPSSGGTKTGKGSVTQI